MKKAFGLILAIALLMTAFPLGVSAASQTPILQAEAAILVDMTTGDILFEQNSHEKLYPASTTKMMTAILAIENIVDLDKSWTADQEVYATGGTRLNLINGETAKLRDVLYATMVKSANDGAVFLAKATGGTTAKFAEMMNAKAQSLGATDTHFVNPSGLHDPDHYTTAYDLSLIAQYCMKNELFRDIVSTPKYDFPATNLEPAIRPVSNTNLLLYDESEANMVYVGNELRTCKYEGILGIKTGYTPEAQGCLVSAAERGGTKLLCVVLHSTSMGRFSDSIALLDWGFDNYKTIQVMKKGQDLGTIPVKKGAVKSVSMVATEDIIVTVPAEASDSMVRTELELPDELPAPVEKGQKVGDMVLTIGTKEMARYDVLATDSVAEGGILSGLGIEDELAHKIFKWVGIGFGSLFFLAFSFVMIMHWRAVKRRKAKEARKAAIRAAKLEAARRAEEEKRRQWNEDYDSRYRRDEE